MDKSNSTHSKSHSKSYSGSHSQSRSCSGSDHDVYSDLSHRSNHRKDKKHSRTPKSKESKKEEKETKLLSDFLSEIDKRQQKNSRKNKISSDLFNLEGFQPVLNPRNNQEHFTHDFNISPLVTVTPEFSKTSHNLRERKKERIRSSSRSRDPADQNRHHHHHQQQQQIYHERSSSTGRSRLVRANSFESIRYSSPHEKRREKKSRSSTRQRSYSPRDNDRKIREYRKGEKKVQEPRDLHKDPIKTHEIRRSLVSSIEKNRDTDERASNLEGEFVFHHNEIQFGKKKSLKGSNQLFTLSENLLSQRDNNFGVEPKFNIGSDTASEYSGCNSISTLSSGKLSTIRRSRRFSKHYESKTNDWYHDFDFPTKQCSESEKLKKSSNRLETVQFYDPRSKIQSFQSDSDLTMTTNSAKSSNYSITLKESSTYGNYKKHHQRHDNQYNKMINTNNNKLTFIQGNSYKTKSLKNKKGKGNINDSTVFNSGEFFMVNRGDVIIINENGGTVTVLDEDMKTNTIKDVNMNNKNDNNIRKIKTVTANKPEFNKMKNDLRVVIVDDDELYSVRSTVESLNSQDRKNVNKGFLGAFGKRLSNFFGLNAESPINNDIDKLDEIL